MGQAVGVAAALSAQTNKTPNLLVPGRCFSADRKASASARVQTSMICLGQAAGFAVAQCAASGRSVRDADIDALRGELIRNGANI